MYRTTNGLTAACLIVLAACTPDAIPSGPMNAVGPSATSVVTEPTTGPWARIVEGETGPGSQYALYIPRSWNGDAVHYAHGVRFLDSAVDLRDQDQFFAIRDALGAKGFAVAWSSFSENGFAIKDGVQRTHQLRGLLNAQLDGPASRHFLMSHSLGSGVALQMVQRFPDQYNGALLMCGIVGGSRLQVEYAGHVRAVFDAFFPGLIPGDVIQMPEGYDLTLQQVIGAVISNPAALYAIASLQQTPLPFVPVGSVFDPSSIAFQTLVGSLYGQLRFQTKLANNVTELAHGSPFDNALTQYAAGVPLLPPSNLTPAVNFINANVKRYTIAPPAEDYLENYFTSTGNLNIPVLTLHNRWDPGVPAFHEDAFAAQVASAGKSANLLQRLDNSYGHCALPASLAVSSFDDLVSWVSTGNKPAN